jgi:hypothetical protein
MSHCKNNNSAKPLVFPIMPMVYFYMSYRFKQLFARAARHVLDPESAQVLDAAILNECLGFALQWGNELGQATKRQLAVLHPQLADDALTAYDSLSRKAMLHGHRMFYAHAGPEDADRDRWVHAMRADYAWVSDDNLGRIYSQGSYFAWREGLTQSGRVSLQRWHEPGQVSG